MSEQEVAKLFNKKDSTLILIETMKMKKLLPFLLGTIILLGGVKTTKASHIPAANLTWTCDPATPLCYTFRFMQIINCPSSAPATISLAFFTFTNDCGLVNPTTGTMQQVGVSVDVAQTCSSDSSTCAGGTIPGAWLAYYETTICLPADCDSWTIDYYNCCRDANSNTAGGTGNNMHVQSVMNTLTAPCNNGPQVTSAPIPYMCAGQNNTYCLTAADPDADSTYYQMTAPMGLGGVAIAYNPPYTVASPLQGLILDPQTGCMTFNQPTVGNFVVAVMILSYDVSGNLISSIIHDFQMEVIACTNNPPLPPAGGITNFSGTGTQFGPTSVGMCMGESVCFDVVFTDPNGANTLTLTTDGTTLMPGATFTTTGTNPITGTFCWTSQPGYSGQTVTFNVKDDACPIVATTSMSVQFQIFNESITAGFAAPANQCLTGNSFNFNNTGTTGATYAWDFGDTPAGTSTQENPNYSYATVGTYTVQQIVSTGVCVDTASVVLIVSPASVGVDVHTACNTFNWIDGNSYAATNNTATHTIVGGAANGCDSIVTLNLTMNNTLPIISFSADNLQDCAPLSTIFTNTGTIGNCTWTFGDGNTVLGCGPIAYNYENAGSYDVSLTVVDGNGCGNSDTAINYINVYANPIADFTYGPQPTSIYDPNINFTDQSWNAAQWQWNFSGLGNSTQEHPSFDFTNAGSYEVGLLVTTLNGCTDSTTNTVIIGDEADVFVPNSFTPDGDGLNDYFFPVLKGFDAEGYTFMVFDRWGELLFQSSSLSGRWDGTYKGEPVQEGVYIWKLKATAKGIQKEESRTGHVNLLK